MHYRPFVVTAVAVFLLTSTTALGANHVSIKEDAGWIATAVFPEISRDTPVDQLARDRAAAITHKHQHDFIVWAKDEVKANGKPDSQFSYQSTPTVTLMSKKLVSLLWTNEADTGGEHPSIAYDTLDVGLVHGKPKELTLADLFKDGVDPVQTASHAIIQQLLKDPDTTDVQQGRLTELTPGLVGKFYLGDTAITFVLSPDIAARYAIDGIDMVKIPYAEMPGLDPYGPLKPIIGKRE